MDAGADVKSRSHTNEVAVKLVPQGDNDDTENARNSQIGPFPCPRWLNPLFWFFVWLLMALSFKFIWVYRFVLPTNHRYTSAVLGHGSFWTIPSFATLATLLLAAVLCCYIKIVIEWSMDRCRSGTYDNLDIVWSCTKRIASASAKYAATGARRAATRSLHGVTTAVASYRTALANGAGAINSLPQSRATMA